MLYKYYEGRLKIGNLFFGISYFHMVIHGRPNMKGRDISTMKKLSDRDNGAPIQNRSRMADKSCSMGKQNKVLTAQKYPLH